MERINLRSVLGKAIQREEEAFAFYTALHDRIEDATARDTLQFLAAEEKKHREFLVAYRDGQKSLTALPVDAVVDYQLAQHLDAPDPDRDMESSEVYLVAAHREMASHNFYKGLAALQPEGEVREVLKRMAAEELRHKEKVEYLYANTAFVQTAGG
ncbi:ferritin family protein [Candidatus Fermentibacteria bacterium]|nr:ferritin family protein [Candidatus Fermentibacteria bacterium]